MSCDALQVYRGLPVLTNQPARPTRLVGIRDLGEEMSVGEFAGRAHAAIHARRCERATVEVQAGGGTAEVGQLGCPGDVQFVHNHTVLHARAAFEDHDEPERRRHLLRLWLSARQGRPLPGFLAERWGTIAVGARRGGIVVPGQRTSVPLAPGAP